MSKTLRDSTAASNSSSFAGALKFELSDSEFRRLRDIVYARTGIALSDAKRELLYGRLSRRLRKLQVKSFAEYCVLVESGDPDELQELTNAITTNLTSFFRENHHFDELGSQILPQVVQQRQASRRIRVWSAGCSTGEEPYSIACVLKEKLGHLHDWDVKLLATDIDSKVLATAAEGRYRGERFRGMPPNHLKRFPPCDEEHEFRGASDDLKSLISFKRLNLLDAWPMRGPFDVIFCRNVIIYFDKDTQRGLFERMAGMQEPGSWLFIGHSENLFNVTDRYQLASRTMYQRT
jgi:chemotaxis protein methyltransferase CheR